MTGQHARVTLHPADETMGNMIYGRVEEGPYVDGEWELPRHWTRTQTDYGLNFSSATQLLRVTMTSY